MTARKFFGVVILVLLTMLAVVNVTDAQGPAPRAPRADVGTAFTYQGNLKDGGVPANGVYDFYFALYVAESGGAPIAQAYPNDVTVTNGYFTTLLDFGAEKFIGEARWVGIWVRPGASTGAYTQLTPRQALTPAPIALSLPGLHTQQHATSPNIIGGVSGNGVSVGVYGATINGGGYGAATNLVSDNYGVIGGGANNNAGNVNADTTDAIYATVGGGLSNSAAYFYTTVSGGQSNTASGTHATVGGGYSNLASGIHSTIAGGYDNSTTHYLATVGGGLGNNAINQYATISGGTYNTASGYYSIIPGGSDNVAAGDYSFAAGRQAVANHQSAFVWADSSGVPITSTMSNQFVIRASNGVWLTKDAGDAKSIAIGERYRDNAIIAWGDIGSTGEILGSFGVNTVVKSTGIYTITLTASPSSSYTIVPVVIPEVDSPPTSADTARMVTTNITGVNQFVVYITNGSYSLVNQQFLFMVTGR